MRSHHRISQTELIAFGGKYWYHHLANAVDELVEKEVASTEHCLSARENNVAFIYFSKIELNNRWFEQTHHSKTVHDFLSRHCLRTFLSPLFFYRIFM